MLFRSNSQSLPKLTSIESVMASSHLILCCPLLVLPPIPPSIRVFSNDSTLRMRWPKYWSFSFSISLSKEHPGLISRRMDWCAPVIMKNHVRQNTQKRGQRGYLHRELASGNVSLKQMYHLFQETSQEGETKVRHQWEKMTGVRESPVVDFRPLGFSLKSTVILVSYT